MTIALVIVTPAPAVRAGLQTLFGAETDLNVVAEAAALADLEAFPAGADVLVMTPSAGAREELEALVEDEPAPFGLLLLGETSEDARLASGLAVRGWGLLPIDASAEEFLAAVRAVHEGLLVGSPPLMEATFSAARLTGWGEDEPLAEPLTDREGEVLDLLASGLANKQIAVELGISEHTVKFHVSSIYAKLGASNRAEAVRLGARQGWITL